MTFFHLPRRKPAAGLRGRLHEIIFEADTPAGRLFDVLLIWIILLSVAAAMLDSVRTIHARHGGLLLGLEWGFTLLFTLEYLLRLATVGKPALYARSFFGIIDLLAVLPTYLSLIVPGTQVLLVIRILRVLRIFRVLKLVQYVEEADILAHAIRASARKVAVFFSVVITLVVIFGSIMYVIEGEAHGYTSIPRSIYWAIITMTTVGYGDITPRTAAGQTLASLVMLLGFAIIAVPTGIVVSELDRARRTPAAPAGGRTCAGCGGGGHQPQARHCQHCGARL